MATNLRIVVAGMGALAAGVAVGLGRISPSVERVEASEPAAREADVVVLAGEGPVGGMVGFCKAVREKSADVVMVVAGEGSEGLVRMISGEVGASSRVLGVGTVAYTRRFRKLIARRCRVAEEEVHAFVVGKSAGALVPLWSTAAVGSVPLHHWAVAGHGKLGVRDRVEIFQAVKEPLSSEEKVGAAVEVVEAIVEDRGRVLPVCRVLGEYVGVAGVCLSVPCVVNGVGAEVEVNVPLNAAEEAGLRQAGEIAE
jgi:malate/lactate dehydrogenase